MPKIDIVIPVYNEGENIHAVLDNLLDRVTFDFRVLICYDLQKDTTLPALKDYPRCAQLEIAPIKKFGQGAHDAIMAGFAASRSPALIVMPADDTFNAGMMNAIVARFRAGADIVCASRFMAGGYMKGCPWLKAVLVRMVAFSLHRLVRLPTHDPTSGFRLFSRKLLQNIEIESNRGFAFSLELLVKGHRLGRHVAEVPAQWFERTHGQSRFRVLRWLPIYLRWYFYAFATTFLRRGPDTVVTPVAKLQSAS